MATSDSPAKPEEVARYVTEQVVMSNGCVTVSVCVQTPGTPSVSLLTTEPAEDLGQSAEIAQDKIGANDAVRTRKRKEETFLLLQKK